MFIGLKFMSIRRKKADYLMVLIKHVINIPLSHTQRPPLCHSRRE